MKTYQTTEGYTITKNGRGKLIYFNNNGELYFVWNGKRIYLDHVMRLTYPVMYNDDNGKTGVISGYLTLTNWYGVLVEINDSGDTVQLWNENRD